MTNTNTNTITTNDKIEWAKEQVKTLEWNVKYGGKFEQIQAKVKLEKIKSITEEEFIESAIASYDNAHMEVAQ